MKYIGIFLLLSGCAMNVNPNNENTKEGDGVIEEALYPLHTTLNFITGIIKNFSDDVRKNEEKIKNKC